MPNQKLTPAFVMNARAEPDAERTIYWDTEPRGFGLMVTRTGAKSFIFNYRTKLGRQGRLTIRTDVGLKEARRQAEAALGDVAKDKDPVADQRRQAAAAAAAAATAAENSLKNVAEEYLKREGKNLRSVGQIRAMLERLIYPTKLAARPIESIKRSEIVKLLDTVEDERGPVMADRLLAALRRIMNWHVKRTDDFNSPIVKGMARVKPEERARKRTLTHDELRAVWRTAESRNDTFSRFIRFLLLTAARRNEPARMTRAELVDGGWAIPPERAKGGKEVFLPLSTAAQAIIASMPNVGSYVFTTDGKHPLAGFAKFKKAFDAACGVTRWTLHDLRRTSRTLMSKAGVDPDHAERCLGHIIPGVRKVYDRNDFKPEKLAAFEKLATQIELIVHPQSNVVPMRAQ